MACLQNIELVSENLTRCKTNSIRALHKFIFQNEGDRSNRKRLRSFEGFTFNETDEQYVKMCQYADANLSSADLISICMMLGISYETPDLMLTIFKNLRKGNLLSEVDNDEDEDDDIEEDDANEANDDNEADDDDDSEHNDNDDNNVITTPKSTKNYRNQQTEVTNCGAASALGTQNFAISSNLARRVRGYCCFIRISRSSKTNLLQKATSRSCSIICEK